jgi:antitoxin component of MazEF toxin-antitoxin module
LASSQQVATIFLARYVAPLLKNVLTRHRTISTMILRPDDIILPGRWIVKSTTTFRSKVSKIGNSSGFRVPKQILTAMNLENGDDVDMYISAEGLLIVPAKNPRKGWEDAAKTMHLRGEDRLLDENTPSQFDKEDWEW